MEVINPLPVTRPHELVALPLESLRDEFADFDLAHVAALRGQEPVPLQAADLDLDGVVESLVVLLPLHPGESAPLLIESGVEAAPTPQPSWTVQVEHDPVLLRRLDRTQSVDARLPVPVIAGVVRDADSQATPWFPPGSPVRVLEPGPLWASVEVQGREGARLRIAVAAGSPRVFLHFLPGPGVGRAVLVPGSPEGAAIVEVRPPQRSEGLAAAGVFRPDHAAAVLYRRDQAECDPHRGQLRFKLTTLAAGWHCQVLVPWDGDPAPKAESAAAFGRELEALTELAAFPPIVRW